MYRNFSKFTGKHLCQSLFFNKVAGLTPFLRSATLLKKRLWHRCLPVNFAKFLRTPFLQDTSGRLLLYLSWSLSKIWVFKYKTVGFSLIVNISIKTNITPHVNFGLVYQTRHKHKWNKTAARIFIQRLSKTLSDISKSKTEIITI